MMKHSTYTDHRSRVAAERRERKRRQLLESAMLVFAEKGAEASVVRDVIEAAQVSQGTFYNYFRTNEELQIAIAEELHHEMVELIIRNQPPTDNPIENLVHGFHSYLYLTCKYPLVARFIAKAGMQATGPTNLSYQYLPNYIEQAIHKKAILPLPMEVIFDLIAGVMLATIYRIAIGAAQDDTLKQATAGILRSLGISQPEAIRYSGMPVRTIEPDRDTLLVRSHLRYIGSHGYPE